MIKDSNRNKGVTISPLGSIGMHLLFPGRAEEYVPVLPLTTRRHLRVRVHF